MQPPTAVFLSVCVVSCLAAFYAHPDTSLTVLKILGELLRDGVNAVGQLMRAAGSSSVDLVRAVIVTLTETVLRTGLLAIQTGFDRATGGVAYTGHMVERAASELQADLRQLARAMAVAMVSLWDAASLRNTAFLLLLGLGAMWLLPPTTIEIIDRKGRGWKAGLFSREHDEAANELGYDQDDDDGDDVDD